MVPDPYTGLRVLRTTLDKIRVIAAITGETQPEVADRLVTAAYAEAIDKLAEDRIRERITAKP